MADTITVQPFQPPRGGANQGALGAIRCLSLNLSRAWGTEPGRGVLRYVGSDGSLPAPIVRGAKVQVTVGASSYWMMANQDRQDVSPRGSVRELEMLDFREYLKWDWIFAAFNMREERLVQGRMVRRFWHILPQHFPSGQKTYTPAPLTAAEILDALFGFTRGKFPGIYTVETNWARFYHRDMRKVPVFNLDWQAGVRLSQAVTQVTQALGLVFTLDHARGAFALSWVRKGEGSLPTYSGSVFPADSDGRRTGTAFSGAATRVRVAGGRNRYQIMDVPMLPDWNVNYNPFFLNEAAFIWDIFMRGSDENGTRYSAVVSGDPDRLRGWFLAAERARQITLREYEQLRGDVRLPGEAVAETLVWSDPKTFAGRARADMPVWIYLKQVLFKAFTPRAFQFRNYSGISVPVESMLAQSDLLAAVSHDVKSGQMYAEPGNATSGNGYAVVQGYAVDADVLANLDPDRFDHANWLSVQNLWQHVPFQLDAVTGSGLPTILFDEPMIKSSDFFITVAGKTVLKARPTITVPAIRACLVMEAEPFYHVQGSGHRDAVESVPNLAGHFVVSAARPSIEEVPFSDGQSVKAKAVAIAKTVLASPFEYQGGGYTSYSTTGVGLSGMIDRVNLSVTDQGTTEQVDFTKERGAQAFTPERDLSRRSLRESLLPGQERLQEEARQFRTLANAVSRDAKVRNQLRATFRGQFAHGFVGGVTEGSTLPIGTVLWKPPTVNPDGEPAASTLAQADGAAAATVFAGVVARDGEDPNKGPLDVAMGGDIPILVKGPVNVNESVGKSEGQSYLVANGSPSVGSALQAISDDSTVLILCRVGVGGGGGSVGRGSVWK